MGTDKPLIEKFRPKSFSAVLGQEAVVRSIRGVVARRTAQTFLFTGPSGVGKTTLARIVARAFGCTDDGHGIIEVNAALHNGVDDMRDFVGMSRYQALGSRARAFVIDEVHRLSPQAFDGMLKVLEESPRGVYWMLCTTDAKPIPQTIKTRCLTYALKPVSDNLIHYLLKKVAKAERFATPDDVLDLIAERAEGSPRQALSDLAKCAHAKTREAAAKLLDETDPDAGPSSTLLKAAQGFVEHDWSREGQSTLVLYDDKFYGWDGVRYHGVVKKKLRQQVYRFLHRATVEGTGKLLDPKPANVSAVIDALVWCVDVLDPSEVPCWCSDVPEPPAPADRLIPLENGLFDVHMRRLIPHQPRFFNLTAAPYAFKTHAPKPVEWLRFLDTIWPDDDEAKRTLQEIFGYLIARETNQEKIFLLVGPGRSGKGTISRVLTSLLGPDKVAWPKLENLGTHFDLADLIGKWLAIVSDLRLSATADHKAIVDRLMSISGRDPQTIPRKHRSGWTGTLPTRFAIMSNELPQLKDPSGALASRFLILTMRESFLGREDKEIADRVKERELPGVLNWSLQGLKRLEKRGHFITPQSSHDEVQMVADLSSPIRTFVRESCTVAPGRRATIDALYSAYIEWCRRSGERPGSRQVFGRDLKALLPHVRRREGTRADFYDGIGLKER